MSRKPLKWNDLASTARAAPPASVPTMRPDFPSQVWERLQTQLPPHQKAWGVTGLGWFAAASVALAITLVALNRDLLDLTHEPVSPLVDELIVSDWTALDSPL